MLSLMFGDVDRVKWMLGNECLLSDPRSSRSIRNGSGEPSMDRDFECGTDVIPSVVSESESDEAVVDVASAVSTQVV